MLVDFMLSVVAPITSRLLVATFLGMRKLVIGV